MDRLTLSKRITSILSEINRLTNTLYAMNMADIQRYPENYEVLSSDAALRAETIACRLRHLIYRSTGVKKGEYLLSAAVMQDIHIEEEDGIIEIKIPVLLPNRKAKQGTEYVMDPFIAALDQYSKTHAMPELQQCVVCFAHVYKQGTPRVDFRDYDNLELKRYLDIVSSYILSDDSGLLCDAYNTTEMGDEECTRIFIMDSARFPDWLNQRQNAVCSITDL